MITATGYSKDPGIMPEGIAITWSEDLANSKGGIDKFCERFERLMAFENGLWLNKCSRAPKHDLLYVYIIVAGKLAYRCLYGGFSSEIKPANDPVSGYSWCHYNIVLWSHIVIAGPFIKCPFEKEIKGFLNFRYTTKLF